MKLKIKKIEKYTVIEVLELDQSEKDMFFSVVHSFTSASPFYIFGDCLVSNASFLASGLKTLTEETFDEFLSNLKSDKEICKNCKWFNPSEQDLNEGILDSWIVCEKLYMEEKDGASLINFGCNRFERR